MTEKQVNARVDAGGFMNMLCVLFIGLKITGHVNWNWGWVFAPLWAPLLVVLTASLVYAVMMQVNREAQ